MSTLLLVVLSTTFDMFLERGVDKYEKPISKASEGEAEDFCLLCMIVIVAAHKK